MERQFPLLEGRGRLTVREEGPRALCRAELPDDGRGLYKAYLSGSGGSFLLGTLIPERGTLRLSRTLTLDELKRLGVWPPEGASVKLAFSAEKSSASPTGWVREEHPARLLGEPLLSRCVQGLRGALLRRGEHDFFLALPWRTGETFPLTPLFCFARPERIAGREYAVFQFNAHGCPRMPHKIAPGGQTTGEPQIKE